MDFLPPLQEGRLIRRYKRFFADILLPGGSVLTVHCPNTGSMRNCIHEGTRVWFSCSDNPRRKLPGTLELLETPHGRLACVNTQRANPMVEEALRAGVIAELSGFTGLRREVPFGDHGRVDFMLDYAQEPTYMEVKSVTLGFPDSEVAAFPDSVTVRGARHLRELAFLARRGIRTVQFYCVNLSGISAVRPAAEIDADYAAAFGEAVQAGVVFLAYAAVVTSDELRLLHPLPVLCAGGHE